MEGIARRRHHHLCTMGAWTRGVTGNDLADRAAKLATGWRPESRASAPCTEGLVWDITSWEEKNVPAINTEHTGRSVSYPILRSSLYRSINATLTTNWRATWSEAPTGKDLRNLDPSLPSKKTSLGLHGNHKPTSSLTVQLRTQKIGLKAFLYSRRIPGCPDSWCQCREGQQTVKHILLQCPLWRVERRRMQLDGGEALTRDISSLLTSYKGVRLAVRFFAATGILQQFRHVSWQGASEAA